MAVPGDRCLVYWLHKVTGVWFTGFSMRQVSGSLAAQGDRCLVHWLHQVTGAWFTGCTRRQVSCSLAAPGDRCLVNQTPVTGCTRRQVSGSLAAPGSTATPPLRLTLSLLTATSGMHLEPGTESMEESLNCFVFIFLLFFFPFWHR